MLFHAAHIGDVREVQRLLSQGADVNYLGAVVRTVPTGSNQRIQNKPLRP
jgi:hypothetical protein